MPKERVRARVREEALAETNWNGILEPDPGPPLLRKDGQSQPDNYRVATKAILFAMALVRWVRRRRVFHRKFCDHRAASPFWHPPV